MTSSHIKYILTDLSVQKWEVGGRLSSSKIAVISIVSIYWAVSHCAQCKPDPH